MRFLPLPRHRLSVLTALLLTAIATTLGLSLTAPPQTTAAPPSAKPAAAAHKADTKQLRVRKSITSRLCRSEQDAIREVKNLQSLSMALSYLNQFLAPLP